MSRSLDEVNLMKRIEIRVRNDEKAKLLFDFLRSLDFVELTETNEQESDDQVSDEAFFALAGIWEGRDVTLDTIRHKAWPRRPS
jgi:hypothetical protein